MARILPFRKPRKTWRPGVRKKWKLYPAVPVWLVLTASIAYFHQGSGGNQFVSNAIGSTRIATSQKFTFCKWSLQRNCVIDGDTIRFSGRVIRIEGIDTPEIRDYKCESELSRGLRAKSRLLELINTGPIEIVSNGGLDEDIYGRKLRHLERNGLSLGEFLIDEGLARRYENGRQSWC